MGLGLEVLGIGFAFWAPARPDPGALTLGHRPTPFCSKSLLMRFLPNPKKPAMSKVDLTSALTLKIPARRYAST